MVISPGIYILTHYLQHIKIYLKYFMFIYRDNRDWGLFQMDAVADRVDINRSFFMVLTHFGEHTLHHMFPTLDHSVLTKLHPVFAKTCEEYKTKLRISTQLDMFIGYYRQIAKTEPKNFNIESAVFCRT